MRLTTFTLSTLITTTTRLRHAVLKESNLLRPISLTALCASSEDPKSSRSEFVDKQQAMFDTLLPIAMLLGSLTFPEKAFAETKVVPSSSIKSPADISYPELRDVIQKGKVYVIENFIDSELLAGLREDVKVLVDTNQFSRSGLSNRAKGSVQGFSKKDRSVSPVTFDNANNSKALILVGEYIDQLRLSLAVELNRPTMSDITLAHESYFSRSLPGSKLNRHLDERHEETKGRKGWTTPSRRSISWLLYLCGKDWDVNINGGGLLSFPQKRNVIGGQCGEDDGNLQVGWWKTNAEKKSENNILSRFFYTKKNFSEEIFSVGDKKIVKIDDRSNQLGENTKEKEDEYDSVQPVFMDIWRKETVKSAENENKYTVIPRTALYIREKDFFGVFRRIYITRNFDSKDPDTGAARDNYDDEFLPSDDNRNKNQNGEERDRVGDSVSADIDIYGNRKSDDRLIITASTIDSNRNRNKVAERFLRIEDIPAWERGENPAGSDPQITPPKGCSLVLFDSVSLPHEVMETIEGERIVLAGWLHERQQDVPSWFDIAT